MAETPVSLQVSLPSLKRGKRRRRLLLRGFKRIRLPYSIGAMRADVHREKVREMLDCVKKKQAKSNMSNQPKSGWGFPVQKSVMALFEKRERGWSVPGS